MELELGSFWGGLHSSLLFHGDRLGPGRSCGPMVAPADRLEVAYLLAGGIYLVVGLALLLPDLVLIAPTFIALGLLFLDWLLKYGQRHWNLQVGHPGVQL